MTLLGVGSTAGSLAGNTTTLGRIGRGFMYADWKSQVSYTTPNMNGFQATVGVTQGWNVIGGQGADDLGSAGSNQRSGAAPAVEAKAQYAWTGDVAGKVWVSAISQKVQGLSDAVAASFPTALATARTGGNNNTITDNSDRANAWDIGTSINVSSLTLTGYYGQGKGIGQGVLLANGFDTNGKRRDSDQWYVQAMYQMPTKTKVGVSYGESTLDGNRSGDGWKEFEQNMWTVGAYHPLTKHLNLVAEYSQAEDKLRETGANFDVKAKTVSAGAILFF
jgi:hypothetical protein